MRTDRTAITVATASAVALATTGMVLSLMLGGDPAPKPEVPFRPASEAVEPTSTSLAPTTTTVAPAPPTSTGPPAREPEPEPVTTTTTPELPTPPTTTQNG